MATTDETKDPQTTQHANVPATKTQPESEAPAPVEAAPEGPVYDDDVDATIADLTPSGELIDVLMPNGKFWAFAPIGDMKARRKLVEEAVTFASSVKDLSNMTGAAFRKILKDNGVSFQDIPNDTQDLVLLYQFHKRCRRPGLNLPQAVKLFKAPETVSFLDSFLNIADKEYVSVLRGKQREELQGKSREIPSMVDGSPSEPESSGEGPKPTLPTENPPS